MSSGDAMPDNPIAAALRAAALAGMNAGERFHAGDGNTGPGHIAEAARTVAAFHNRLAAIESSAGNGSCAVWHQSIASAVEQGGRQARGGAGNAFNTGETP